MRTSDKWVKMVSEFYRMGSLIVLKKEVGICHTSNTCLRLGSNRTTDTAGTTRCSKSHNGVCTCHTCGCDTLCIHDLSRLCSRNNGSVLRTSHTAHNSPCRTDAHSRNTWRLNTFACNTRNRWGRRSVSSRTHSRHIESCRCDCTSANSHRICRDRTSHTCRRWRSSRCSVSHSVCEHRR
jgi:hypothetical protein